MTIPSAATWQPPASFDEYTLVKQIGRGHAGLVYVVHDTLLDRHVAAKFIAARDETLLGRFLTEARAAARIQHPNVATLYRVGQLGQHAYLIWELVRGKSLDQFERPMPADRVLRIATDVVRGLAAAHRRGVLHRDIKPGNIMVADTGEAKLVDFGLAAILDVPATANLAGDTASGEERPAANDSSTSGKLLGTPYFMSPEAWRGDELDARSDLYAMGLVLYELLAGEGPFRHLRVKELASALQQHVPQPLVTTAPSVPAGLGVVVDRCLRLDRQARFANADELLAALEILSPSRGAGAIPEGNPYRGLRTYEAEHRALFFGRGRGLQLALERLRSEALLVVTGDSGVGKSSLCAAGVLPAIAEGGLEDGRRWLVGRTVPGRTPLRNLADVLAHLLGGSAEELRRTLEETPAELGRAVRSLLQDELGLLLYLDQMEELVTLASASEAALVGEGLASLVDGIPGVRVLGTARSDFLSRLAGLPGLGARFPAAILLLGPMSEADVREAIVGPAAIKGGRFESTELVDSLVASTLAAEGSLPLLQFTLAELWERRDRTTGVISADSLTTIGGVSGALARHADAIVIALAPSDRLTARRLLLRLVTVDDTRTRRTEEELQAVGPNASMVLEALVRGRLLVASESPDGTTYEIAHEALVRGWTTLAQWLVAEAELRAARHRLEVAAAEWHRLGRNRELLWSGRQLAEVDDRLLAGLGPRERAFLDTSRRARRVARWVRRGVGAVVVAAIAGTWIGVELKNRRDVALAVARDLGEAETIAVSARGAAAARAHVRRAAFTAWDALAPDVGERAWQEMQARTAEARAGLAQAAAHLERALLRDPARDDVRALYADVLLDRALLAFDEGNSAEASELTARLALYDATGTRRARLDAPASLTVTVVPSSARLELARPDGSDRRLLETAGAPTQLPAGAWMVTAVVPGHVETRQSLYLDRGEAELVELQLPRAETVPAGYVFIPPGEGAFGSSEAEAVRSWFNAVPLHVVRTGGYLIARHETTFAEWTEFLDDLPIPEREQRRPRVAGTGFRGMLELSQAADHTWQITLQPTDHLMRARWGEPVKYATRDRRVEQDWRRMPVSGISYDDAVAYSHWLERTGRLRAARICSEHEWERAARGTADRKYPHGDVLRPDDANFDETYGKQSAGFGPDEVGAHPASTSPFGVTDLSGNVWEWVRSSVVKDQVVARGGSYYFSGNTARVTNRELPEATYRDLTVGVRICADFGPVKDRALH